MDRDLHGYLNDLLKVNLRCIFALESAKQMLTTPNLVPKERESIMSFVQSIRLTMQDVRANFESTIGYHND